MRAAAFLSVLLPLAAPLAEVAVQTDWSGGPGQSDPCVEWGDSFLDSDSVSYACMGLLQSRAVPEALVESLGVSVDTEVVPSWGDIDGDGDADLLTTDASQTGLYWYENPGNPGAGWIEHYISGCPQISTAELMEDSSGCCPAAVLLCSEDGYWSVEYCHISYGDLWMVGSLGEDDYAAGATSAMMDGNEIPDIIGWNSAYGEILAWWDYGFYGRRAYPDVIAEVLGVERLYPMDMDSDGQMDFGVDCVWYPPPPETYLYQQYEPGSWCWWNTLPEHEDGFDLAGADFDADGHVDLVGLGEGNIPRCFTGFSLWNEYYELPGSALACESGDLDGDGDREIALLRGGCLSLMLNQDSTYNLMELDLGHYYELLACADIDGDGVDEVVVVFQNEARVAMVDLQDHRYSSTASLTSSVLDAQCQADWDAVDWTCNEPPGTSLGLRLRAGNDPASPGSWSDTLGEPGSLEGILPDSTRYLQYEVLFESADTDTTPMLWQVQVSWNPMGIWETPGVIGGLSLAPNPSRANIGLTFQLAEPGEVSVDVLDLCGRIVENLRLGVLSRGSHSAALPAADMPAGIYTVRVIAPGGCAAERCVILR
jgi:hypothetical protein